MTQSILMQKMVCVRTIFLTYQCLSILFFTSYVYGTWGRLSGINDTSIIRFANLMQKSMMKRAVTERVQSMIMAFQTPKLHETIKSICKRMHKIFSVSQFAVHCLSVSVSKWWTYLSKPFLFTVSIILYIYLFLFKYVS